MKQLENLVISAKFKLQKEKQNKTKQQQNLWSWILEHGDFFVPQ